jgi:hypothetical protein
MPKTALSIIKSWFETGDFPTQEQFWNWMDSYWHKDELIPVETVNGLASLLAGKATLEDVQNLQQQLNQLQASLVDILTLSTDDSYTLTAGKILEKIVVIPTADLPGFGIGQSPGGFEILNPIAIPAAEPAVISLNLYAHTNRIVYFTGILSSTTIKIYKR